MTHRDLPTTSRTNNIDTLDSAALTEGNEAGQYRTPQMFVLGKAEKLVRRSISGHLIDGNGGWYVWGS